ncbi:MAG: choice-of-anchor Q domain-containing protein [Thermoleophilaceae bacterium]
MRTRAGLVVVALALLAAAGPATAATVQVSTHADENNGCTPGHCSLREAVPAAGAGGLVIVPTGTFLLGSEISIPTSVTIRGNGPAATIVDGQGNDRLFRVQNGNVTISAMKLTGGNGGGPSTYGGAVLSGFGTSLTLDRMRITGNTVTQDSFGGNQGSSGGGGVTADGALTVTNSSIDHNNVDMHANGSLEESGGGGIYSSVGPLVVRTSEVSDNTATASGSEGGNSSVANNGGGGIWAGGAVTLDRSTVGRNTSSATGNLSVDDNGGGGIYSSGGAVQITNSTIAGNSGGAATPLADNGGGGIYLEGGSLQLGSSTVAGNSARVPAGGADAGGGLYVMGASAKARNTIIAGNSASDGFPANCVGSVSSQGHNIEDRDDCGLSGPGDKKSTAVPLGPLAFNGGATRTRAITRTGPAFDAGRGCPGRDQRGVLRPAGQACDVGAFEIALPLAATGGARGVRTRGARLTGTVNPNGVATTYRFQYGKTKTYGSRTAARAAGRGSSPRPASGGATGLSPATSYHYRLVAKNALGTTRGRDRTFITHMKMPSGCVKDRKLTVPLGRPKGQKVVVASARIGKNQVAAAGGSDVKRLKLDHLPGSPFRLDIVAKLGDGRRVLGSRRYKPC